MSLFSDSSSPPDPANVVIKGAACDPSVNVGDVVRFDNLGVAVQAQADSFGNANAIGVVQSKPSSTVCNIRVIGVTPPIFAGLDTTLDYLLSDSVAGGLQSAPPSASGHVVLRIGQAVDDQRLFVIKGTRSVRS